MESIKYFVLFACFAAVAFGQNPEKIKEIKEKMKIMAKGCIAEVGASAEDEAQLLAKQVPTSHEGKCVLFCVHKLMGTQDESGKINEDTVKEMLSSPMAKEAFGEEFMEKAMGVAKICKEKVARDADPCQTAANMMECCMTEGKAAGLDAMGEFH